MIFSNEKFKVLQHKGQCMRLTFYGEIRGYDEMTTKDGELLTLPCVHVDCAQWLIIME